MIIRLPYAPRPNSAQKSARIESAGWLYVQKKLLESVRAIQRLVEGKTLAEVASLVEGRALGKAAELQDRQK